MFQRQFSGESNISFSNQILCEKPRPSVSCKAFFARTSHMTTINSVASFNKIGSSDNHLPGFYIDR